MVSRNTTLVPSFGLRMGPACEVSFSAGMQRDSLCHPKREKKRKKDLQVRYLTQWKIVYI